MHCRRRKRGLATMNFVCFYVSGSTFSKYRYHLSCLFFFFFSFFFFWGGEYLLCLFFYIPPTGVVHASYLCVYCSTTVGDVGRLCVTTARRIPCQSRCWDLKCLCASATTAIGKCRKKSTFCDGHLYLLAAALCLFHRSLPLYFVPC